MKLNGLTEFQKDLLQIAQKELPKEMPKALRKVGNKARTTVAKKARALVKKKTGRYHKKWKRGKVFKGSNREYVTRVINSSPHGHLIEDGHRMVDSDGNFTGDFVPGKKPLDKGMREFEASNDADKIFSDWLDEMLRSKKL